MMTTLTLTLNDSLTGVTNSSREVGDAWPDLLSCFTDFIRGAGYVIPYNYNLAFICSKCGASIEDHSDAECNAEHDWE